MAKCEVIKSSGACEGLDRSKIRASIIDAGVRRIEAEEIIDKILMTLEPPVSTKRLYRAVKKYLRSYSPQSNIRYSIKKAIYSLGPTGYPFEKYVAKILEHRGYDVNVGVFVNGRCVKHEVDVVAIRGKHCYMVECKFHHAGKTHSNVKTALYAHARFLDIRRAYGESELRKQGLIPKGMLVTNTRFSSEAIKYADCVGLKVVGWKHPVGESLESIVESGKTYPVTVLPVVNSKNVGLLLKHDIVTVRDIEALSPGRLEQITGFDRRDAERLFSQARSVCS